MQEKHNPSALVIEVRLSCINPSICPHISTCKRYYAMVVAKTDSKRGYGLHRWDLLFIFLYVCNNHEYDVSEGCTPNLTIVVAIHYTANFVVFAIICCESISTHIRQSHFTDTGVNEILLVPLLKIMGKSIPLIHKFWGYIHTNKA